MTTLERLATLTAELRYLFPNDFLGALLRCHQIGREARQREFELLEPCRVVIGNETLVRGGSPESVLSAEEMVELRLLRYFTGFGSYKVALISI